MVISNNAAAGFILGTLNKNINKKSKASSQLALGEKIRNAGDDASGYAISERMRVRIRSLDQADANVQNGASMLRVAEGAIQSQINLLRTVKAKVIDAHNDTNTDADRVIIQKEITQYYNEINDIAAETTFNGKHLLLGTKVEDSVKSWYKLDHAELLEDSDTLGLISGSIASLDGQDGPFATFGAATDDVAWDGYNVETLSTKSLTGGEEDIPRKVEISFQNTTTKDDLDKRAFKIVYPGGEMTFVFAHGTNHNFRGDNVHILDLDSESGVSKVIKSAAATIKPLVDLKYSTDGNGFMKITFQTVDAGAITNDTSLYNIEGVTLAGGDGYEDAASLSELSKATIANIQVGRDGNTASYSWDLSSYNTSSTATMETFISQYVGQGIYHSGNSQVYEFIDSSKSPGIDSITKLSGATTVDLNQMRSAVSSGKTIAAAFAELLTSNMGSSLVETVKNTSDQVTGVKIRATVRGVAGNSQSISFKKGDLRDYTINFNSVLSGDDIPAKLDGKGFRFYDASDPNKWVNVLFVNGTNPNDDDRPASGTSSLDIDTLVVDVSDVTDVRSLIKTLYQGDSDKNPLGLNTFMTRMGQNFRLAADYDAGTITIYDNRRYTVMDGAAHAQQGAKIADGIMDNVVNDYRYIYTNDLVIQHTDRSSANIHVYIPQTTIDHILGYKVGAGSLDDFTVLTSEKREMLLGRDYPTTIRGTLDKGLQYLIDANTLIGAQINHMENADANIITETENTTAAESVIRDADIAKSAMDLAKYNILSQSAQAMLSQFNHNSSDVLNLLQ